MTDARQPWYKHYPADWRGDANLRLCTLAARGLWTECLGLMHEAEPRGYLTLSTEQLALMVGRPLKEVRAAIADLERNGVPSRDEAGRLYSRRMVRDTARSLTLTENGRRGGHPVLVKPLVNQDDDSLVKPLVKSAGALSEPLSSEPLVDLVPNSTALTRPAKQLLVARFETFWDAYPKKIKRKEAFALFTRLNPDAELLAKMLEALAAWKLSRDWREGFAPHPTTWLRGEQWTDQVPPEPVVSGPMTRGERAAEVTRQGLAGFLESLQDGSANVIDINAGDGGHRAIGVGPRAALRGSYAD